MKAAESSLVEIYEVEVFSKKAWVPHEESHWTLKSTGAVCKAPEEITLPNEEWCWTTNWKIDKKLGVTDEDGWEYASKLSRLNKRDRDPKPEVGWNSKVRRRTWSRTMKKVSKAKTDDFLKDIQEIEYGLMTAHNRANQISKLNLERIKPDILREIMNSVQKNINEILIGFERIEHNNSISNEPKKAEDVATASDSTLSEERFTMEDIGDADETEMQKINELNQLRTMLSEFQESTGISNDTRINANKETKLRPASNTSTPQKSKKN